LTGICMSDAESCDKDVSYEEIATSYKELCVRSEEVCKALEKQKRTITRLQAEKSELLSTISGLNDEVTLLNSKIEHMRKQVRMMNNVTDMLEEILEVGQKSGKKKGIDFDYQPMNTQKQKPAKDFVPSEGKYDPTMSKLMFQHPKRHQGTKTKTKPQPWICHYYGRKGNIRPFCFKLYGFIAHTSFKASSREDWYFDSGCSRHMTGFEKFLVDIKSYSTSFVTFGDGAKGEIKGVGKLINSGLLKLEDVLLVKGLTANLISISQLCDQGLKVNFTKSECLVTNDKGDVLMKGVRSKDNCYLWVPQEAADLSTCLISKEDEVKLWHQKHGHLNLREMKMIISEEAIRGLPKLKIEEGNIC
ncbi:gag-pol polyprotein, partial [Trifolium medium]|nr:gag-pol polyprotein [Trifolium medium]